MSVQVQATLGNCYERGMGVEQDMKEAVKWFRKAAKKGEMESQASLGFCYLGGDGVDKDRQEGVEWLQKAAHQGHERAKQCLAALDAEIVKMCRLGAEQGNPQAQFELAMRYQHGEGVEQDMQEAFQWCHKAAEQDYADAQYYLALQFCRLFNEGDGVKRYKEEYRDEMKKWLKKAAEQGHEEAIRIVNDMENHNAEDGSLIQERAEQGDADYQYALSVCYLHGMNGVEQDFDKAVKWSQRAAEQGQERAQQFLDYIADNNVVGLQESAGQFMLGTFYLHGIGIPPDGTKAKTWLEKAAEQGHELAQELLAKIEATIERIREAAERGAPEAQMNLSACLWKGDGVEQNREEAKKWLRKAAEQGHEEAQETLARITEEVNYVFEQYRKEAKQGDAEAQFRLSLCYFNGKGVDKDEKVAMQWLQKAAEQGLEPALASLYCCYRDGTGVEADKQEAIKWLRKSAELGHVESQVELSRYYSNPEDDMADVEEAHKWLRKAAEQGHELAQRTLDHFAAERLVRLQLAEQGNADAQYNHGISYINGVEKNIEEGIKWLQKSAEQGHEQARRVLDFLHVEMCKEAAERGDPDAQYELGVRYLHGAGVEQNIKETIKWLALADDQGHEEARQVFQSLLTDINKRKAEQGDEEATLFLRATGTEGDDPASQFEYIRVTAEEGNSRAQFNLGNCYNEGHGVEEDKAKAVYWWRKAAEHGYVEAQRHLGYRYYKGDSVEKDIMEALKWWKQAAEQGDPKSQFEIGQRYCTDDGVDEDMIEAVKWFQMAAEQGFAPAQYNLAVAYANGDGVPQDMAEANKWSLEAAKQGYEPALKVFGIDPSKSTPLHIAARFSDAQTLDNFIRQGANVNIKDGEGQTPLIWAAMAGCSECCRLLLGAGADVNAYPSATDKRTAFHHAIWNWHKEVCEMLLEAGADLHALDADNETPLHWAAKHGPVEALEFLLKKGARTNLKDNQGNLPIDVADSDEKKHLLREAMTMPNS